MDARQRRCCRTVLIAAVAVLTANVAGTTTVDTPNRVPHRGETTAGEVPDLYGSPAPSLCDGCDRPWPPIPADTESGPTDRLWLRYNASGPGLPAWEPWTTELGFQSDQSQVFPARDGPASSPYTYSDGPISVENIALETEFLAARSVAGEEAAMPPPFVCQAFGEGDSDHATFQVVGDAEPISSLPVIPAPVAILLAGFSVALIAWSRHRRAM